MERERIDLIDYCLDCKTEVGEEVAKLSGDERRDVFWTCSSHASLSLSDSHFSLCCTYSSQNCIQSNSIPHLLSQNIEFL